MFNVSDDHPFINWQFPLGMGLKRHVTGDPWIQSDCPELHHYTGFCGLKGIWESNCLWATRYTHLNDATEIQLMRAPLIKFAIPEIERFLRQSRRKNVALDSFVSRHHGAKGAARKMATEFVETLYGICFESTTEHAAAAVPYVACFCSHANDRDYERHNGLLSQWRAYGRNGYCIVFDAFELAKLLAAEFIKSAWFHINIDAVVYHDDDFRANEYFMPLIDRFLLENAGMLDGFNAGGVVLPSFIESATLLKHQGFKEEREIRIVAAPITAEMLNRYPNYVHDRPPKRIYNSTPTLTPYIALFDTLNEGLPIKRVIVGPSAQQKDNFDRARAILGENVELVRSETPYIG